MSSAKAKQIKAKIQKIIDEKLCDLFSALNALGYTAELHIKIEYDYYKENSFEVWKVEEIK